MRKEGIFRRSFKRLDEARQMMVYKGVSPLGANTSRNETGGRPDTVLQPPGVGTMVAPAVAQQEVLHNREVIQLRA